MGLLVFFHDIMALSPLKKLSNTTREIAKGKYSDRAVIQTKDEIGLLAEDFNKMADSLETKIRDLEATTISQRDFIGSFAHEVKTPLTSIIGYADMLRSKKRCPKKIEFWQQIIFLMRGNGWRLFH